MMSMPNWQQVERKQAFLEKRKPNFSKLKRLP